MMKFLYKKVLKPILFLFDPEVVHDAFVWFGALLGKTMIGRWFIKSLYGYKGADSSVTIDGIEYKRPVMLAAGFDYNGQLTNILDCIAFGGEEIGSVTARPCAGNDKPRLTRLIKSNSLIVNKGLRNDGVDKIILRLRQLEFLEDFVVGVSIARTNDRQAGTIESGIEDYYYSLNRLIDANIGDFYTINISCPNAHGGESFTKPDLLDALLYRLTQIQRSKPMYIKMPINLPWDEFNLLLEVIDKYNIEGVIIGNLNKDYGLNVDVPSELPDSYKGGLSGKPCAKLSNNLIRLTKEHYGNRFTIIGCGGILSAEDAMDKFNAGADLLQLITGMIFEGPHLMKEICERYAKGIKNKKSYSSERKVKTSGLRGSTEYT